MFTGIITHLGTVESIEKARYTFSVGEDFLQKLKKGGSVAVNGACLTAIEDPAHGTFMVEAIPETLEKTMLGTLRVKDLVNLELPMSPQNLFEGHIVQGHVDGTGTIENIVQDGNSHVIQIQIKPELSKYMIVKGSVTVNGVALTIINIGKDFFTVGIIPYTFKNTTFKTLKKGDAVNIEVDMIAKYIEKLVLKSQ